MQSRNGLHGREMSRRCIVVFAIILKALQRKQGARRRALPDGAGMWQTADMAMGIGDPATAPGFRAGEGRG